MKPHSGSILRKLQWGFALGALTLALGMALFMDHALQESLETEDAQVMEGQARPLLERLRNGGPLAHDRLGPQLEKAEWRVLDTTGNPLAESPGMARIPTLPWPSPGGPPRELDGPAGGTFTVLVRAWNSPDGASGRLLLAMDRTHEEALLREFRKTLAAGVALSALLAALLGRLIAAWGLRPLRQIVKEAGGISDRNLDRRLELSNFPSELQDLVNTLNATLARLQTAFDRLDHLGAELAHELRTPLQRLRSTLENLALGSTPPEQMAGTLGELLEACDRMAALIEQILFLARQEHLEPSRRQRITVAELLHETAEFFEAAAEEAGVSLALEAEPSATVNGERLLLLRALHNLMANGIRHSPRGSRLCLGCANRGSEVLLWVEDQGTGYPPELLPELGLPFLRGPNSAGGLGLGLALVRRIAGLHEGRLQLEATPTGGARANFFLPASEHGSPG